MAKNSIHVGAVAPYRLRYTLRSTEFDLSLASAVSFHVRDRSGENPDLVWVGAIVTVSQNEVVLEYIFQAGDLTSPCQLLAEPRVTTPAGEVRGEARAFAVVDSFNL